MPDPVAVAQVVGDGTHAHPAAVAWRLLSRGHPPRQIRILKERSKGLRKSAVYWLAEAGPEGEHIVAKLAQRAVALREAHVYETLLAPLGTPAPRLHGSVEHDERFTWLFLDDVGGRPYEPLTDAHRRLAGGWLARLHVRAAERVLTGLPDRGLEQFLMALRTGARATESVADHPDLSTDERTGLRRARRALDVTEARWPEIQALAAPLPVTLVHGDLVRKNVRVAGAPGESTLLAFDWERSGRGTAALDLAQLEGSRRFSANPCLDAYRAELRNNGLDIPLEDVRRAAMVGTILRCLDGVEWAASGLSPRWVHNPTADLTVYGLWLDRALQTIGLLRSGLDAS
jgi:hypothetical protein